MARKSGKISVFGLTFQGLKTYLNNLDIFFKYLAFPVLGLFGGIFLLFLINYFYIINLQKLESLNPLFSNPSIVLTFLILIIIPAFIVIIKALLDYIIAFGAINSMCVVGEKRVEDIYFHKEVIKRRFLPFCLLIFILSLIFIIFSFPLLLPLLLISVIFLSLSVQVFTLEENSNFYSAIKKSIDLVKSNLWFVIGVLLIITFISYVAVPYLICWAIGKTPLLSYLALPVENYLLLFPVEMINDTFYNLGYKFSFDVLIFSEQIVYITIAMIVSMFMLPYRCACCVNMYRYLAQNFEKNDSKEENSGNKKIKKSKEK